MSENFRLRLRIIPQMQSFFAAIFFTPLLHFPAGNYLRIVEKLNTIFYEGAGMNDLEALQQGIYEKLHRRPAGIDKLDRLWDAAVLLPIVATDAGPSVLFEVRSLRLYRQPGEVCFPGGRYECADKDFRITAIRETCEELGLEEADIRVLGELDALVTHTGPIIHPFVGFISDMAKIRFNADEVQEVFTVPLQHLLEQEPLKGSMLLADRPAEDFPFRLVPGRQRDWRLHKEYNVYFYQYRERVIWGLTARMLYAFLRRSRDVLHDLIR